MEALLADAEAHGAVLATRTAAVGARVGLDRRLVICTRDQGSGEEAALAAGAVVNAAGKPGFGCRRRPSRRRGGGEGVFQGGVRCAVGG